MQAEYETLNASWQIYKRYINAEPLDWDALHRDFEQFLEERPGDLLADSLAEALVKDIVRKHT